MTAQPITSGGPAVLRSTLGGSDAVTLTSRAGSWWRCDRCSQEPGRLFSTVRAARRDSTRHRCPDPACQDWICAEVGSCICEPVAYVVPGTVMCQECWAMQTPAQGPACLECGSTDLQAES